MNILRRGLPTAIAVIAGLLTLAGLLVFPALSTLLLEWAAFLAAAALVAGILNLLGIHLRRTAGGNIYSLVLVLGMLLVFGLAVSDALGLTNNGVSTVFNVVQAPLEAALASLLAFFLLFGGIRLWQRQRSGWSFLFLLAVLFLLVAQSPLPASIEQLVGPVRAFIVDILVTPGLRGLLLGIALGTITLSLRLLAGLERPYSS
jgi:hypothetical protein